MVEYTFETDSDICGSDCVVCEIVEQLRKVVIERQSNVLVLTLKQRQSHDTTDIRERPRR